MAKKKIVLIENDEDISSIVSFVLEQEGYEVVMASPNPANLLKDYGADVILLDEWVNDLAGDMLCLEIKAIHEIRHIPVIIFSTAMDIEAIVKSCKADGFIRKPFDLDELVTEIERCTHLSVNKGAAIV